MTDMRVAFIGAGNLANRYHYPSITALPDVDLEALCDLVPQKAEATAERFGVPRTYGDYKQMLWEVDPQVVYIVMPPQFLFEPVTYALKQGRHVFIEKPAGLTTYHSHLYADLAEKHHCLTQVGFQRRHVPAMTALRARVEARGPVHTVSLSFLKSTKDLTKHAGFFEGVVDPLTSDGIHAVDNLRWLAGGEATRVVADVSTRFAPGPFPNAITAHITFDNGAVGLLHYSLVTGRRIYRAEMHGPNVTAYVDPDRESYIVADDGEPEVFQTSEFGKDLGGQPEHWLGFWHEHRHFIDCIREGRQPSSHFADAVKTMELVDRILAGG
jgi:predicted dehydrogenase